MHSKASLASAFGALVLSGCAGPPDAIPPPASQRAVLQSGSDPLPPADLSQLDKRAWLSGEAIADTSAPDELDAWWGFSLSIGAAPDGTVTGGSFLISNAGTFNDDGTHDRITTFFGNVTSGTITWDTTNGGGSGSLDGVLTTGKTIHIAFNDVNNEQTWDGFQFTTGTLSFAGDVRCGNIRIVRALPESFRSAPDGRFQFDWRIGLFLPTEDMVVRARPEAPLPNKVLQVIRPDPVIDFREDDLGGYASQPGSEDNLPP